MSEYLCWNSFIDVTSRQVINRLSQKHVSTSKSKSYFNKKSLVSSNKNQNLLSNIIFILGLSNCLRKSTYFFHEKVDVVVCGSFSLDNFQFISLFWHFVISLNMENERNEDMSHLLLRIIDFLFFMVRCVI